MRIHFHLLNFYTTYFLHKRKLDSSFLLFKRQQDTKHEKGLQDSFLHQISLKWNLHIFTNLLWHKKEHVNILNKQTQVTKGKVDPHELCSN